MIIEKRKTNPNYPLFLDFENTIKNRKKCQIYRGTKSKNENVTEDYENK